MDAMPELRAHIVCLGDVYFIVEAWINPFILLTF
jgi:hypothetical protein